jgi:hypothetical protein
MSNSDVLTEDDNTRWTQQQAVAMCRVIEDVCPEFGAHVALTGGTLYKVGTRKDCDILFYRIRQAACIDMPGLWAALGRVGLRVYKGRGWCFKAMWEGRQVDCFFPEQERDAEGNEVEYGDGWEIDETPVVDTSVEEVFA